MDYKTMKPLKLWNSYNAARAGGKHAIPLVPHVENKLTNYMKNSKRKRASRIQAKRTRTINQGRVMNEGTGGQCSYFFGRRGKTYLPSHVLNALPPQVSQYNQAQQLKSVVGQQNISPVLALCQPSIATTYTGDSISHVVYEKATGDITLNNIYLSNCYVIIYDVIARKDVGSGTSANVGNPTAAWIEGVTDESQPNSYKYLGSTPWQSDAFNQYWKVVQVTDVVLCAGGTHVHKVRLNPNRSIAASYATYTASAFKDLTYYCLIEIHGSPANDTTTQTQVGVGVAGLNIIVDQEHTLKQIQNAKPQVTNNNNLITAFTVGEQVVNLGGSTVVPQAEG